MNNLDKIIKKQLQHEAKVKMESNMLTSTRPRKRQRMTGRISPVIKVRFQEKHGTPKYTEVIALLDSGASENMVDAKLVKKLRHKEVEAVKWNTPNGQMSTNRKCKLNVQLPELSSTMTINDDFWSVKNLSGRYDMIIGVKFMEQVGIDLSFKDRMITYEHVNLPMTDVDSLPANGGRSLNDLHYVTGIEEPPLASEAVKRVSEILDAKYAPVTPEQILENSSHLTEEQKRTLKPLLIKHRKLFDGTLGKWKGIQHQLELKDPKATPFASRPYAVPVKNKATLILEINRLCKLGVLRKVNRSEWQSPSSIIPKKDQTVRFITDFRKLNEHIKRKPFLLPNINNTLRELCGFQFGTSLDLNMG